MFVLTLTNFGHPICVSKDRNYLVDKRDRIISRFANDFYKYLEENEIPKDYNFITLIEKLESSLSQDNSNSLENLQQALKVMTLISNDLKFDLANTVFSGRVNFYKTDAGAIVIRMDSFFRKIAQFKKDTNHLSEETKRFLLYMIEKNCFSFDIVACEFGDYLL
jgi:hypothetical protein